MSLEGPSGGSAGGVHAREGFMRAEGSGLGGNFVAAVGEVVQVGAGRRRAAESLVNRMTDSGLGTMTGGPSASRSKRRDEWEVRRRDGWRWRGWRHGSRPTALQLPIDRGGEPAVRHVHLPEHAMDLVRAGGRKPPADVGPVLFRQIHRLRPVRGGPARRDAAIPAERSAASGGEAGSVLLGAGAGTLHRLMPGVRAAPAFLGLRRVRRRVGVAEQMGTF